MICPQCESAAQLDYWHVGSYLDRRLVYANALAKFGERGQLVVALEELSECQKEICKILRQMAAVITAIWRRKSQMRRLC